MTKLKICGLREVKHAITATDAGADFLGFVFVSDVRRQISDLRAADLIREVRQLKGNEVPKLVGLFANQPIDEVNRIVRLCGLDLVQLCGDEPPNYWNMVDAKIIRQVKVRDQGLFEDVKSETFRRVDEIASHGHMAILDKDEPGYLGGTGRVFDWTIAAEIASLHEIFLAGGLTPGNVREAIEMARPWGVDVSSGVETEGVKDLDKIIAFSDAVGSGFSH